MTVPPRDPPFGQADLSNCERELIHLAGSIQPHGVLFVVEGPDWKVRQASANVASVFGIAAESLIGQPIALVCTDLPDQLSDLAAVLDVETPRPLQCRLPVGGHAAGFEGVAHRLPDGAVIVELEPIGTPEASTAHASASFRERLAGAVSQFSGTTTIGDLADEVVKSVRDLTGFDRVMVYKFDPDGHGEIIAEARDGRLDESFLGRHYPATDIPQRARELYLRTRVRVLVDVNYEPVPVVPRLSPHDGGELDMSLCTLRSMSPLHLQYLRNMGVTATLVVSLVREGALWGLIACHHYSARYVRYAVRAAADLIGEVVSTRITAIDSYLQAQSEVLVRRIENRLIEATATEGDWRLALIHHPPSLLLPLNASGAALAYGGEIMTVGEVPSTQELRTLVDWVRDRTESSIFSCNSVERANPALASLTPVASGVLAFELAPGRPDFLVWFRKEQLAKLTWAGDPSKPMVGSNPLELSPRRSFAAWIETVRGTAQPWTRAEIALARAIGEAVMDIVLQVHAVRLLIAQEQAAQIRKIVESSKEPVLLADPAGRVTFSNDALARFTGRPELRLVELRDIAPLFTEPESVEFLLARLAAERRPFRGELTLANELGEPRPVGLRADVVPGENRSILGYVLILTDLTQRKEAEAARRHFEDTISITGRAERRAARRPDRVIGAILANASMAAVEIGDPGGGPSIAPILEELEHSAQRAAALYHLVRLFSKD